MMNFIDEVNIWLAKYDSEYDPSGFFVRTCEFKTKEDAEKIKQKILKNQKKAEKWDLYLQKGSASEKFLERQLDDIKFLFEKYHDFLPLGMYNEFVKLTKGESSQ